MHLLVGHEGTEEEAAREQRTQVAKVAGRMRAVNATSHGLGGFNAQPGDSEMEPFGFLEDACSIAGEGGPDFVIPSHFATEPDAQIDVIYVNNGFRVTSTELHTSDAAGFASEHLPVVAPVENVSRKRADRDRALMV